jgi:tRNA threonylcarbamoyladenosine biosynthesis protein TsaE
MCDEIFTAGGVVCRSEEETRVLARDLAGRIAGEATLSLEGPLGAGKTCFVQGLAEGLGLDRAMVSSPTFTLVHEYPGGRIPFVHFDLYRLNSDGELAGLGYEEYFQFPGLRAIEWATNFQKPFRRGRGGSGFRSSPKHGGSGAPDERARHRMLVSARKRRCFERRGGSGIVGIRKPPGSRGTTFHPP